LRQALAGSPSKPFRALPALLTAGRKSAPVLECPRNCRGRNAIDSNVAIGRHAPGRLRRWRSFGQTLRVGFRPNQRKSGQFAVPRDGGQPLRRDDAEKGRKSGFSRYLLDNRNAFVASESSKFEHWRPHDYLLFAYANMVNALLTKLSCARFERPKTFTLRPAGERQAVKTASALGRTSSVVPCATGQFAS